MLLDRMQSYLYDIKSLNQCEYSFIRDERQAVSELS